MSREHLLRRPNAVDTAEVETPDSLQSSVPAAPQPVSMSALTVGRADDPVEAAADVLAGTALSRLRRMTATKGAETAGEDVHRHAPGCEHLRRQATASEGPVVGMEGGALDTGTASRIAGARGSGRPLPGPLLERMEGAFGAGFGHVRIHDDSRSAQLNRSVSAKAFTTGNDIFFGEGTFAPHSPAGEQVLAHELAHVVQDAGAIHRWPWDKDTPEEAEKKKKKKEAKENDKKEAAAAKATQKQSALDQKTTKTEQAADRKVGMADRAQIASQISGQQTAAAGPATKDGQQPGKAVTSTKANDLNAAFALALTSEKEHFELYTSARWMPAPLSEEEATTRAYKETWLDNPDPQLRAVRPPRETAAERLVIEIRHARTNATVRGASNKKAERGSLLEPAVEKVYEEYVEAVAKMMAPPGKKKKMRAEAEATAATWDMPANADAKALRDKVSPVGSALDTRAIKDAQERLSIKPGGAVDAGALDSAINGTQSGDEIAGPIKGLTNGVGSIVAATGSEQTKALQSAAGRVAAPDGLETKIPGGVGTFAKTIEQSKNQVADQKKNDDDDNKDWPQSVKTEAGEGIKTVTGVLGGLLTTTLNVMKFAKAVQTAHSERSAANILAATKAAADALKSMGETSKSTAGMAKLISPGLTSSVGSVIPGLNIFTSVMSMIGNSIAMGQSAIRVQDTDDALFSAQSTKPKAGVNVLVYPLLRVLQSYTKGLEKSVWDTAISISDFSTGVATVATGGGFGIPVAVQAGVKVLDALHSVGHFIADQVLVSITKKAQGESLQSLEGAAENSLQQDPAMAIDGIILSAVRGDPIAMKFVGTYAIDDKPIDEQLLKRLKPTPGDHGDEAVFTRIRAAMLAGMGEDTDPQYFYQKWREKIGGALKSAKAATSGKWSETKTLAEDRNALGGKRSDRGYGWRIKMMFSTQAGHERSKAHTAVNKEASQPGVPAGPVTVLGTAGNWALLSSATPDQQQAFAKKMEAMTDDELKAAAAEPKNTDQFKETIRNILADRVARQLAPASA